MKLEKFVFGRNRAAFCAETGSDALYKMEWTVVLEIIFISSQIKLIREPETNVFSFVTWGTIKILGTYLRPMKIKLFNEVRCAM